MILVHLSVNGKPALIDSTNILFAEECEGKNNEGKVASFTRLYLKQPLLEEDGSSFIDVHEQVGKLLKEMK